MMPMYTYVCTDCGEEVEFIVSIAERDQAYAHANCGGALTRLQVESFQIGAPSYVPGAVTSQGELIPGHFGKDARKKGGRYKP
jgi:putative FmdB family regulatory protein